MFKSPHLMFIFCCSFALVGLIFIRFLWFTPFLLIFDLNDLHGRGADTVSMRFWVGNCSNGSAERRVRLQLCVLVSTLGCHGLGRLINFSRFLDKRAAPSKVGWMPSLLIRPGFLQNVGQLFTKPTLFSGHHLDSQRLNEDMRLNMSSLVRFGRGPEKTTVSDIVLANVHTDSTLIFVTSDWRNRASLPPTWITILLNLRLLLASSFRFDSMSPALAPGIHLTMLAGAASFTFRTMELPITRVCLSAGVSLSGENLLETWMGWWWAVGFDLGLCFLRTVTQPPGCSGAAGGRLAEATVGRSAPATGVWLATVTEQFSMVRSRASNSVSLASSAINKLHLLQLPLSLKEAGE